LVFIFENIHSVSKELETKELDQIKRQSRFMADYLLAKYPGDIPKMRKVGYFDKIRLISQPAPAEETINIDGRDFFVVNKSLPHKRTVVFEKLFSSSSLETIRSLDRFIFGIMVVIGIFLFFNSFYLVYLFKRDKEEVRQKNITPLQQYLTELKQSETALKGVVEQQQFNVQQKEELNKHIIDNINAAVIFINPHNKIDIFNITAQQMFSQSFANAKNNDITRVLAQFPGIVSFLSQRPEQKLSSEVSSNSQIFRIDAIPIPDSGELLIIKDITMEKAREEIARKHKNFAMLGEMAAFLAHEVRNSLGVILGYTQTIKSDPKKTEKIDTEIQFLTTMMQSFMNFARPLEVEKKQPVNIAAAIQKAASQHEIPVLCPDVEFELHTDPALLNSVFTNLFINAQEAGASEVRIGIDRNNHLEIEISDNGKGIGASIREKIWYPFFTTKDKGTGMGLALVRKIITTLGGDIAISSTGESGTTFTITFLT
jgi:signal transduction histidine kinase